MSNSSCVGAHFEHKRGTMKLSRKCAPERAWVPHLSYSISWRQKCHRWWKHLCPTSESYRKNKYPALKCSVIWKLNQNMWIQVPLSRKKILKLPPQTEWRLQTLCYTLRDSVVFFGDGNWHKNLWSRVDIFSLVQERQFWLTVFAHPYSSAHCLLMMHALIHLLQAK